MNNIKKAVLLTLLIGQSAIGSAQFRMNMGDESPLRKLQFAEMAITNLYVDSVDEKKLA